VIALSRGVPLLWDEAVYSLRVRDLVGPPVRGHYWIDVRAPGLPLLLSAIGLVPGSDALLSGDAVALRSMCLGLAVAGVAITWLIARALIGPRGAAVAACLLAIAPGWHESSWQVMPDIPGAVLTLTAMAVILSAARDGRLSWWALLAAPLCGAATLVRYGAPLLIGPAVVAALLLRWDVVRTSKVRGVVVLASTALAAAVVWFVPIVTGTSRPPVAIFMDRQDDKAVPALQSAADFATRLLQAVGPVFGLLVVVGGAVALVAALRHRALRGPVVACALIPLSVLAFMLFGIAQYNVRYLAPALPFLAILAAAGLVRLTDRLTATAAVALAVGVGIVGAGVAADTTVDRAARLTQRFGPVGAAYRDITRTIAPPCVVLDHNPTAEWYTDCAAFGALGLPHPVADPAPRGAVGSDEPLVAVLRHHPDRGNPSPAMQALLEDVAVGAVHRSGDVTVLDLGTVERYAAALGRRGLPR